MIDRLRVIPDIDPELKQKLLDRGHQREVVEYLCSLSSLPILSYAALANVDPTRISKLIEPGKNKLNVCYPFPKLDRDTKRPIDWTGPKHIVLDEKAINYLKKMKYATGH